MLRSVLTLAACLATTAATAPRPALLQLRGGGGVVEEQPKTGKLWVARSVENSRAPMAMRAQAADGPRLAEARGQPVAQPSWRREEAGPSEPADRSLSQLACRAHTGGEHLHP